MFKISSYHVKFSLNYEFIDNEDHTFQLTSQRGEIIYLNKLINLKKIQ